MSKKFKIIFSILAMACLIFAICACSCEAPESSSSTESSHDHDHTEDNQKPAEPQPPEKECVHYWYNVTTDTGTASNGAIILNGECFNCGDKLSKEVVTRIEYEQWKSALSFEGVKSFTLNSGVTYTDYDETGSMSWKITGESKIYTEEYFVNMGKTAQAYVTESFSGYLLMYNSFKYDEATRSYIYQISDTSHVEIMFADGKIFSLSTVGAGSKTSYLYLNYDVVSSAVPQYFFDIYGKVVSLEGLASVGIAADMAEKINAFLSSLSFELPHEISFIENGGLSVYFYVENGASDPIFGESYGSVTVVAKDEKIVSLSIGNNTIDFE